MGLIVKCLSYLLCLVVLAVAIAVGAIIWAYQVVDEGDLYMPNAPGNCAITREQETGIAHIRGDSFDAVAYA